MINEAVRSRGQDLVSTKIFPRKLNPSTIQAAPNPPINHPAKATKPVTRERQMQRIYLQARHLHSLHPHDARAQEVEVVVEVQLADNHLSSTRGGRQEKRNETKQNETKRKSETKQVREGKAPHRSCFGEHSLETLCSLVSCGAHVGFGGRRGGDLLP